jgi:hypothetical protein
MALSIPDKVKDAHLPHVRARDPTVGALRRGARGLQSEWRTPCDGIASCVIGTTLPLVQFPRWTRATESLRRVLHPPLLQR